jgi:hypothetical protein
MKACCSLAGASVASGDEETAVSSARWSWPRRFRLSPPNQSLGRTTVWTDTFKRVMTHVTAEQKRLATPR